MVSARLSAAVNNHPGSCTENSSAPPSLRTPAPNILKSARALVSNTNTHRTLRRDLRAIRSPSAIDRIDTEITITTMSKHAPEHLGFSPLVLTSREKKPKKDGEEQSGKSREGNEGTEGADKQDKPEMEQGGGNEFTTKKKKKRGNDGSKFAKWI